MANENGFDNIYNNDRDNFSGGNSDNADINVNSANTEEASEGVKASCFEQTTGEDNTPEFSENASRVNPVGDFDNAGNTSEMPLANPENDEKVYKTENDAYSMNKPEEQPVEDTEKTSQSSPRVTPDYSAASGERTYIGANDGNASPYTANSNPYPNANSQNPHSNGNGYNMQGGMQNDTQNGYGYERPQSSSIRYDADKRAGDGSYTWNYAGATSGYEASRNSFSNTSNRSKNGTKVFIAVAVAFALICTAVVSAVLAGNFVRNKILNERTDFAQKQEKPVIGQNPSGGNAENTVTVPSPSGNNTALTKQEIANKCKPSSVGIQTVVTTQGFYGLTYKSGGVGSGFILTADGYIATNHHVIEGADSITVQLDDGTKYEATLVGSDSVTDLAVIKIDATGLIPMEIGDSDKMVVGDSVIAIGTPAGIEFAGTVTDGIISAINRGVEITNERGSVVKTMTLMQTNAAINPGNSGGPLINDKGQVIGINTLKLTSTYEGIGFSIPINSAVTIFNQLITDGKVSEYDNSFVTGNGAIGITNYVEISREEAEYYNVPAGIVILQLELDSHAYKAGLKRYDTIVAFEGKSVMTVEELNKYKSAYKAGDEVTLTVYREGAGEMDITFKLDLMG